MAPRSHGGSAGQGTGVAAVFGSRVRFRRRSVGSACRHRERHSSPRSSRSAFSKVQLPRRRLFFRSSAVGDALSVWRARRSRRHTFTPAPRSRGRIDDMPAASQSDALVLFGATGDLAYKQIFPALHAMTRRGHLNIPIIGVAKSRWTVEQFRARARESIASYGTMDPA